jgi:hypothetical protein
MRKAARFAVIKMNMKAEISYQTVMELEPNIAVSDSEVCDYCKQRVEHPPIRLWEESYRSTVRGVWVQAPMEPLIAPTTKML